MAIDPRHAFREALQELKTAAENTRGAPLHPSAIEAGAGLRLESLLRDQRAAQGTGARQQSNAPAPPTEQAIRGWLTDGKKPTTFEALWSVVQYLAKEAEIDPPGNYWREVYDAIPWKRNREPQTNVTPVETAGIRESRKQSRKWPRYVALPVVVIALVGGIVLAGVRYYLTDKDNNHPVDAVPHAAVPGKEPVRVQNVSRPVALSEVTKFATEAPLNLAETDLQELGRIQGDALALTNWRKRHGLIPINTATVILTLGAAGNKTVVLNNVDLIKSCKSPARGTYLQQYTQGGGETNVALGADLDKPTSVVREVVNNAPTGAEYFARNTIRLQPGNPTTISIGAFTQHSGCDFTIRLTSSTSDGSVTQIVDDGGQPFRVTSPAVGTPEHPLSSYADAYVQAGIAWVHVDPKVYTK